MLILEFLRHFTYLIMQAVIVGGVVFILWAFHFRFLWAHRCQILLGTLLVTAYALPMDVIAVARGWGGFNPVYITGIAFFGGALHLEEITFWLGTSFATISAVLIFVELQDRGVPWWALAAGVVVPVEWMASLFKPGEKSRA